MGYKVGICRDCGILKGPKPLKAGLCNYHYWNSRRKLSIAKKLIKTIKTVATKQPNAIKRKPKVNDSKPKTAGKKSVCLPFASGFACKQYYLDHIETCKWECENCKMRIFPYNDEIKYSVQAHILPKEHFPSVKLLYDNHLVLGVQDCACHSRWDLSWASAQKMPIFAHAHAKVRSFIHLLSEQELNILPEIFKKDLKKP